jgi:hypothetical protein
MALTPPVSTTARDFATALASIEARLTALEVGLRTGQLGYSSLQNTGLNVYDEDGNVRYTIGKQTDGVFSGVSKNNPNPPPIPSQPVVIPGKGALTIRYEGETATGEAIPSDWSHCNVYVAPLSGLYTFVGQIISIPGDFVVAPLEYIQHSVKLTNVNYSGKESDFGAVSQGTPELVVGDDLIDGIVTSVKIANDAVTAAKVAADAIGTAQIQDDAVQLAQLADGSVSASQIIDGAVQAGKIAADAVGTNELAANSIVAGKIATDAVISRHILAGAVQAGKLDVDSVQAGNIVANAVTTAKIDALAVTSDRVAANAIDAGKIAAGAVTASKLEADMVISSRIIAGSPTGARMELHPTNGLQAFTSTGDRNVQITAAGNAYFNGIVYAGLPTGQSIALDPVAWGNGGGFPYPRMDVVDNTGTFYGQVAQNGNDMIIASKRKADDVNQGGRLVLNTTATGFDFLNSSGVETAHCHVNSNSVGFRVGTTELFYLLTGSSQPKLEATSQGSGLTFASGSLYVGNNSGTKIPIQASSFDTSSSETVKEKIRSTAGAAKTWVRTARGKRWKYVGDDREHVGPIAEELPDWMVSQDMNGDKVVSAHDIAGAAWEAAAEAHDEVDELKDLVAKLREEITTLKKK